MLQSSLTYASEMDAWKQRVKKELGNTQKFYQAAAMNHGLGDLNTGHTAAGSNMRPYIKMNGDNNVGKSKFLPN